MMAYWIIEQESIHLDKYLFQIKGSEEDKVPMGVATGFWMDKKQLCAFVKDTNIALYVSGGLDQVYKFKLDSKGRPPF